MIKWIFKKAEAKRDKEKPKEKLSETLNPKENEYNPLASKADNLNADDPAVLKKRKSLYGDKNLEDVDMDDFQLKDTEYPTKPFGKSSYFLFQAKNYLRTVLWFCRKWCFLWK